MDLFSFAVLFLAGLTLIHGSNVRKSNFEVKCIDIYKQPSLLHPRLKNHEIQMKPSFAPEITSKIEQEESSLIEVHATLETKNCPTGTVPIQTLRKSLNLSLSDTARPLDRDVKGHQFAVLGTWGQYYGGKAYISLPNPQVKLDQVTTGRLFVGNYSLPEYDQNSMSIGFSVNPGMYGDDKTHLTADWTADSYRSSGCFDYTCNGFVQVHPTIHLGARFTNTTVYGSDIIFIASVSILHDILSGHWWLFYNDTEAIGYYPKEMFFNLDRGAGFVKFGGDTIMSADGLSPPMGNGQWPNEDRRKAASMMRLRLSDFQHQIIDFEGPPQFQYRSNESCSDIKYYNYGGDQVGDWMSYGGPGGACGD